MEQDLAGLAELIYIQLSDEAKRRHKNTAGVLSSTDKKKVRDLSLN